MAMQFHKAVEGQYPKELSAFEKVKNMDQYFILKYISTN